MSQEGSLLRQVVQYRSWHKTEVPPAACDFRFRGLNGLSKCYGSFKPRPSPLMLRHPFAGHALALDNLVNSH